MDTPQLLIDHQYWCQLCIYKSSPRPRGRKECTTEAAHLPLGDSLRGSFPQRKKDPRRVASPKRLEERRIREA